MPQATLAAPTRSGGGRMSRLVDDKLETKCIRFVRNVSPTIIANGKKRANNIHIYFWTQTKLVSPLPGGQLLLLAAHDDHHFPVAASRRWPHSARIPARHRQCVQPVDRQRDSAYKRRPPKTM